MGTCTEKQIRCFRTYEETGSIERTAKVLGIHPKTAWNHIKSYQRNSGESPNFQVPHSGNHDKQRPQAVDLQSKAPPGYVLGNRISQQFSHKDDETGELVTTWARFERNQDYEEFWQWLDERTPVLKDAIPTPRDVKDDLMLEWLLMDHHMGMHSWAKETGHDYSIKLAQQLILNAASLIFMLHGNVQKVTLVLGGDNQHADNRKNITEKSGYTLDVDTRYAKMVDAMWISIVAAVDVALLKAKEVEIVVLSGNHDYHSAINLARILKAHYRNEPRVRVNISPSKHKFLRWGRNAFMYTHGDMVSNNNLASFFLNWLLDNNWTDTDRRLIRKGHFHKSGKTYPNAIDEVGKVQVEIFPTLAAPDAHAVESAYTSQRATIANVWHKDHGLRSRIELSVRELLEMQGEENIQTLKKLSQELCG